MPDHDKGSSATTIDLSRIPESYLALMARFYIRPIRNDRELAKATEIMNELAMREDLDDDQDDYFNLLTDVVEAYETATIHIPRLTGVGMLKYLMELKDVSQAELCRAIRMPTTTLNDLLAGRRKLNVKHIKALSSYFKINPDAFMADVFDEEDVAGDDS